MNEREIFAIALEKPTAAERNAFLSEACGQDAELRGRIEALLRDQENLGSFLEGRPPALGATLDQPMIERPGTIIGPYKLLQQIGEGGMGTVYMAEQSHPVQRKVALKVIKAGMDSGQVIARFEAERQALALMDHPNIAKVLDAGTTAAGRPYFVMELVKGVPITTYCDENHLPPKARLELFTQVCQAVQHAHQKGVIHRDIKPTNVLVTLYDDKPVPKVIDFGVAKATGGRLTERTMFTGYGQIVGTLEYMSPEQARLNALDVDTRGDIYSLGVLLYELLTGTTPFDKKRLREAAFDEMLRMIREEEPPKPSTRLSTSEGRASIAANRSMEPNKLSGLVRGELDWIVMKSLEKDRNRRYESANGFALDIQRYLADEHVMACPPSATYRFRKFARRNKAALGTAAVVSLALVLGTVVSTWQAIRATRAHQDAEESRTKEAEQRAIAEQRRIEADAQRAEAERQGQVAKENERTALQNEKRATQQELLARRRFYAAQINFAHQAAEGGNLGRVVEILESLRPKFDEDDLRTFEWYHLWGLSHRNLYRTLKGHQDKVYSVAFSPDGTTVACGCHNGTVRLWDVATGQVRAVLRGHGTGICRLAFSPDGTMLAIGSSGSNGGKLWKQDRTGWHEDRPLPTPTNARFPGDLKFLAFSPDGTTLAIGVSENTLLWDLATRQVRELAGIHPGGMYGLAFSRDGKSLATTAWFSHGATKLWDLTSDPPRKTAEFDAAYCVAFSPDGKTLATGATFNHVLKLWDVASGNEKAVWKGDSGKTYSLAFSPDGKRLATATEGMEVKVWDVSTGAVQAYPHSGAVHAVAFSPDGTLLASGSEDTTVKLWDVTAGKPQPTLQSPASLHQIAFSVDSRSIASCHDAGVVKVWNATTLQEQATLEAHVREISCIRFSPNGAILAGAGGDPMVRLWDLATREVFAELPASREGFSRALAFTPDGKTLASGGFDGTVRLWDLSTRQARQVVSAGFGVQSLAISPDGNQMVAGTRYGWVIVFDVATGQKRVTLQRETGPSHHLPALSFSPDGKLLAAAGTGGKIKLWETALWQLRGSLKGQTAQIQSLAFFPDGNTLVTAGDDGTVKLWDVATGQERLTFKDRSSAARSVAITSDGQLLAIGYRDGTVALKQAATDKDAMAYKTELDPDDPESPVAQSDAGDRLWADGELPAAEETYRTAMARLQKLAAHFETAPQYHEHLTRTGFSLSLLLRSTNRSQEAEEFHRQALAAYRKLETEFGTQPQYRESVALSNLRFRLARILVTTGRLQEAKQLFQNVLEVQPNSAEADNGLAWLLATCKEPKFRDPAWAVELAKKAVEVSPKPGHIWNTLGVAHYRAGDWKAAIESLENSMRLLPGKHESFDTFFLAMAHWQLGEKDKAREWYDKAVAWMEKNRPEDEELRRFRAEAEELLKIEDKAIPK